MIGTFDVLMLRALAGVLSLSSEQARLYYQSDACDGASIPATSGCEVLSGERCEDACYKQPLDRPCVVECGLQNCHDYSCYEWRCVAYCIDQHVTRCLSGCGAGGSLFCDSSCVVSGSEVEGCVDFLCTKGMSVEGATCG